MWPVHNILGRFLLLIPKHSDTVRFVHDQLISAVRVAQPPAKMLFFGKFFDMRRVVVVIDSAFSPVSIDVGQLIDCDGVLFVERTAIQGFGRSDCLFWRLIFHERIALIVSRDSTIERLCSYPSDILF